MANPTRGTLRTYGRALVSDADSANYGLSDTDWNTLLNEKQHLWGALFPEENVARASSVTVTAGSASQGFTLGSEGRAVVSVSRGGPTGPLLERLSVEDIIRLQNELPATGVIQSLAVERNAASATAWILYPHPIPAVNTDLYFNYVLEIGDFANDNATSVFGAYAAYSMARMVAVDHAMILGRFERADRLMAGLPERVQTYMMYARINRRPAGDATGDVAR